MTAAILIVGKGQTQKQNLTNKQKSVQKLCIRFFVVKSITVFNENKWIKCERRLAWYLYAFLKSYFCRCSSSFPLKRDHWIFFKCCKDKTGTVPVFLSTKVQKEPQKKAQFQNIVRCFCVCPTPTQFIGTSTSKLGGEGLGSDKVFGKCELTCLWDQGGH